MPFGGKSGEAWQDLKKNATTKKIKQKKDWVKTGGGTPEPVEITTDEELILDIISKKKIEGLPNVRETEVPFSLQTNQKEDNSKDNLHEEDDIHQDNSTNIEYMDEDMTYETIDLEDDFIPIETLTPKKNAEDDHGYALKPEPKRGKVKRLETSLEISKKMVNSGGKILSSLPTDGTEENNMPEACVLPGKNVLNVNMACASNSREMRNKAEKQRRDRLNSFIGELATLVPLVSRSAKRMDKTSILRLTATHLRIYQTLATSKGIPHMELPKHVDQFVLEQLICDQMGGFLLIMSPNGKIIFVSHTVETLLGHLQTDLMGQSLFTVTAAEDHDRLRMYLMCEGEMEQGWRKYFNIKIKRAGPRSETPVYEPVRMMGVHRQLQPPGSSSSSPTPSTSSTSSMQPSINTDILVFFVKVCRPEPLVDRLVAASKDEYVTRHLIDARIIDCDQRISLIAGYMIDEIQGHSAFTYMHRDDVRYVMIALRQMYDRGESRGNSCYRLKSRNGQFIYLKTFGFLEIDDQGIVESFLCVNMLVDEKEGKAQIREMKKRYSAMFTSSLASLPYQENGERRPSPSVQEYPEASTHNPVTPPPMIPELPGDLTEDPQTLQQAVNELMQNLPSPGSDEPEEVPQAAASTVLSPVGSGAPQVSFSGKGSSAVPAERAAAHKTPQLRIKTAGKRAPSVSPDHVKRQRLTSVDSEPPQLSPPINQSILNYPQGPPLTKMPKLEEQYTTSPSDVLRRQHHHHAA